MEMRSAAVPGVSGQPAGAKGSQRSMPQFAGGTHGYAHTLDSALVCLQALGIPSERITLLRAGREARPSGTITRQSPSPGTPLLPDMRLELEVAGLGFHHALPVGMWDSGGERAPGTREILAGLDDPLDKLRHWFHEGAPMFRIGPEDRLACARWLTLFGVEPERWPEELWFPLASVIADLPQLACSEAGCSTVLRVLLNLPVRQIHHRPSVVPLPGEMLSRLGQRASLLGVDLLAGDEFEDLAMAVVEIGPVSLETYERFAESAAGAALLRQLLAMLMPLLTGYEVRWQVADAHRPPRLGIARENSRLGVNTHLGQLKEAPVDAFFLQQAPQDGRTSEKAAHPAQGAQA